MHKKVKQSCRGAVSAREASRIVTVISMVTAITRVFACTKAMIFLELKPFKTDFGHYAEVIV